MSTATVKYLGNLRTEATHTKSGNAFVTDAPVDNNGKGEFFSPTDAVCAALASCAITIMGIAAAKHGFELVDTQAEVVKVMGDQPRKIAAINVKFFLPEKFDEKQRRILEKAAETCPVALSLSTDLKQEFTFNYI